MARIFVLAALLVSLCQAQTYQTGQAQIPIAGPLRSTSPSTVPGRKMVSVLDLDGAFVKGPPTRAGDTITFTYQDQQNISQNVFIRTRWRWWRRNG